MLIEDLHTHTIYSHGKGTVEQNICAAIQKGLARVGISEHGPKHMFFPARMHGHIAIRKEIDHFNTVFAGKIHILMGIEANLTGDGLTDMPKDISLFDYVLLGYHKGSWPQDAISRRWLSSFFWRQRASVHGVKNSMAYVHAIERTKKLLAITHPGTYIPLDIPLLARAAQEHGVALELNEGHKSLSKEDLLAAAGEGAHFLISSDAHKPKNVGRVDYSVALAREAGVLDRVINWRE